MLRKKRHHKEPVKVASAAKTLSIRNFLVRRLRCASPWLTLTAACVFQMYIECRVNLCIPTLPSASCPNMCGRSIQPRMLVENLFTRVYTVNSGPVSLVVTTPTPANAAAATTKASTATPLAADATTAAAVATTSHGKVSNIYFFVCHIDQLSTDC